MQQKLGVARMGVFLLGLAVVIIGGLGALMALDVPAPQKPVEKQLDAKAFLEQKP